VNRLAGCSAPAAAAGGDGIAREADGTAKGATPVRREATSLTAEEIAARVTDPAALARLGPPSFDAAALGLRPDQVRAAAVLVPIVLHRGAPTVLLTLRSGRLSSHAGQVSFPGGRIEPGETPETAALREAAEEVGLDPRLPEILGRLPDHLTGTGFRMTPVVALLRPPLNLVHDPAEVEEPFELPLSVVLDPDAPQRHRAERNGRTREYWVWPHARHFIWGATAAVLVNLAKLLRG
jgi:8-oxo-dGTP pyrophosphatase MutT (NUDIX family)